MKEKELRQYLENLDKEALIELYLQICFENKIEISMLKKKNSEIKQALLLTLQFVNKESCYYCPFGCKDNCSFEEDSEECIKLLYKKALKEVKKRGE